MGDARDDGARHNPDISRATKVAKELDQIRADVLAMTDDACTSPESDRGLDDVARRHQQASRLASRLVEKSRNAKHSDQLPENLVARLKGKNLRD